MDCKLEPASRSLLRIECLLLQGMFKGILCFIRDMLLIPIVPFVVIAMRWRMESVRRGIVLRLMLCPWWFLIGCFTAVATPFMRLWNALKDIVAVCDAEWQNRWTASTPKTPDGHPYQIEDEDVWNSRDIAVLMGVLRDYEEG